MDRCKFHIFITLKNIIALLSKVQKSSKRKLQSAFDYNEMRLTALIFRNWKAINDEESKKMFKKDLLAIRHHRRYFQSPIKKSLKLMLLFEKEHLETSPGSVDQIRHSSRRLQKRRPNKATFTAKDWPGDSRLRPHNLNSFTIRLFSNVFRQMQCKQQPSSG